MKIYIIMIFLLFSQVSFGDQLGWRATGDDDTVGTAYQVSAKWAYTKDSLINYWDSCHDFPNLPLPQSFGTNEIYQIQDGTLPVDTVIYLAIKASDEVLLWSNISKIIVVCCNKPGDANEDDRYNILDVLYILSYMYRNIPAKSCAAEIDANGDGIINMLDMAYMVSFLYYHGPQPKCPVSK